MKLLPKFALLSFGVAAVPLAIAGWSSARISQRALEDAIFQQEKQVARGLAQQVTSHLGHLVDTIGREANAVPLGSADPLLVQRFLQLVFHQSDDFTAVFAVSERRTLLASAFLDRPAPGAPLGGHATADPHDLDRAIANLPLEDALADGWAIGPVLLAGDAATAHTVLAVRLPDQEERPPLIIGALVSLAEVRRQMGALEGDERDIFLLDQASRVVLSARSPASFAPKDLPRSMKGTLPERTAVFTYPSNGTTVLAAYASVPTANLGVVVERPSARALAPVRTLGLAAIFWTGISGLVAAVIGGVLARSLSARVGALVLGTRKIAQGQLDTELEVPTNDELGELAKAFNAMATSLDAARGEILHQTDQIKAWNETLEKRVEQKTLALETAQDMLLRARSLAAIGSLGAGVAHEINNPLTGILGLTQLLLADLPDDHPAKPMLRDVESQALRIQSIVANLLRLAQRQAAEDFQVVDLSRILEDALELCGLGPPADGQIGVERRVISPSPPVRGSVPQLQAALMHLIQNARGAMEKGGTLTVETSIPQPRVLCLRLSDTGLGIAPEHLPRIFDPFFTTKNHRSDTGIGLSVVHKIIEDHGGNIRVDSERGQGTTFWITLPIDVGSTPLA